MRAMGVDNIQRMIKVAMSMTLLACDLARGGRLAQSSRGVILLYHDVHEHHRARFRRQLRAIRRYATVVRLDDIEAIPDGSWRVAITFDDGRRTFVDTALEELLAEQTPATLFVPAGLTGDAIPDEDAPLMSDDELVRLPPLIEIGSHGLMHVRESRLSDEQLKEELVRSQHDLEVLIGRPVDRHAYPYGDHSVAVVDVAREVYRSCYTVTPTLAPPRSGWTVGRVVADPDDWPLEFWLKIHGAYRWMGSYMAAKQRAKRLFGRA
jgi:peptidoglycan/xylan/chitin deacetylase (PgdA/CDA1 family)